MKGCIRRSLVSGNLVAVFDVLNSRGNFSILDVNHAVPNFAELHPSSAPSSWINDNTVKVGAFDSEMMEFVMYLHASGYQFAQCAWEQVYKSAARTAARLTFKAGGKFDVIQEEEIK